jgi:hypothetical protein
VMIRVLEEADLGEPANVAGDLLAALDAAGEGDKPGAIFFLWRSA